MEKIRMLIVEDYPAIREELKDFFEEQGFAVQTASRGKQFRTLVNEQNPDIILLDLELPDANGIDLLEFAKKKNEDTIVIMVTATENPEIIVQALKQGAYDYVVKPYKILKLNQIVQRAVEKIQFRRGVEDLRNKYEKEEMPVFIGESEPIRRVFFMIGKFAMSDSTVLIQGRTGTGKEIVAKHIHLRSKRFDKPFISINCGAIPKELVESELFGTEKGAFTGALARTKKGKFELAHTGTLFLDEIGELSLDNQVKLLRALQEQEFYRIGGTEKVKVNVRIVAATNRDLREEVHEGRFREDLYYRLNVAKIFLPDLKDRGNDIILLTKNFMYDFNQKFGKRFRNISPDAQKILLSHDWQGNVRELQNVVERVILMEDDDTIRPHHLNFLIEYETSAQNLLPIQRDIFAEEEISAVQENDTDDLQDITEIQSAAESDLVSAKPPHDLDTAIRVAILNALEYSNWNISKTAKLLRVSRGKLRYQMQRVGIEKKEENDDTFS